MSTKESSNPIKNFLELGDEKLIEELASKFKLNKGNIMVDKILTILSLTYPHLPQESQDNLIKLNEAFIETMGAKYIGYTELHSYKALFEYYLEKIGFDFMEKLSKEGFYDKLDEEVGMLSGTGRAYRILGQNDLVKVGLRCSIVNTSDTSVTATLKFRLEKLDSTLDDRIWADMMSKKYPDLFITKVGIGYVTLVYDISYIKSLYNKMALIYDIVSDVAITTLIDKTLKSLDITYDKHTVEQILCKLTLEYSSVKLNYSEDGETVGNFINTMKKGGTISSFLEQVGMAGVGEKDEQVSGVDSFMEKLANFLDTKLEGINDQENLNPKGFKH